MIAGAPVDILTGKPLELRPETRAEAENAAADELARLAAAGIDESQAAQQVVATIESCLAERIEGILKDDPQAKAYVEILKKLGARRLTGELAAKAFIRRHGLRPTGPTAY